MRTVAVLWLGGTALALVPPVLPNPVTWMVAVAAVLPFAARPVPRAVLIVAVAFAWSWLAADARLRDRLPVDAYPVTASIEARVVSFVAGDAGRLRFRVRVIDANRAALAGRRIVLSWYDAPVTPRPGETWRLRVRLRPPAGLSNPHLPDLETRWFRERVDAVGHVVAAGPNLQLYAAGARAPVLRLRAWLSTRITAALGDRPATGIARALIVGDRRGLSPAQWDVLTRTGTGHLVAISGLHVGLVAAAVFALCRRLVATWSRGRVDPVRSAALAALAAATLYAALAGFSVSTRRALLMAGLALAAVAGRRPLSLSTGLAVAVTGVLVAMPADLTSAGFWLSFGAVATIALRALSAPTHGVAGFFRIQAAVSIGLAPLVGALFGRVSLVAPLVNAVLVPLYTTLIVPLVLVAALFVALPVGAAAWPLRLTGTLIEFAQSFAAFFADLRWAEHGVAGRPVWIRVSALAGAVVTLCPARLGLRTAGVLLFVPMVAFRPPTPSHGSFDVTLLDTGQGLAVVVATHAHTLLYDTGPGYRSGGDAGERVVVPYLRAARPRGPNIVILSHDDLDHTGGARSVRAAFPAAALRVGGDLRRRHPSSRHCRAGDRWTWDGVDFEILHPVPGNPHGDNDASCIVAVGNGGGRVLLTGDIERDAEHDLLARRVVLDADVVVAPHHGSATSSTPGFVHATGAAQAWFAVGQANRWGFPKPRVTRRWREAGAEVLDTARSGAITQHIGPAGPLLAPVTQRCAARRPWTLHGCVASGEKPGAPGATPVASW